MPAPAPPRNDCSIGPVVATWFNLRSERARKGFSWGTRAIRKLAPLAKNLPGWYRNPQSISTAMERRMTRHLPHCLFIVLACVLANGCGGAKIHPVSGKVVYADTGEPALDLAGYHV